MLRKNPTTPSRYQTAAKVLMVAVSFALSLKLLEAFLIYRTMAFSYRGKPFFSGSAKQLVTLLGFLICQLVAGFIIESLTRAWFLEDSVHSPWPRRLSRSALYSLALAALSFLSIRPFLYFEHHEIKRLASLFHH